VKGGRGPRPFDEEEEEEEEMESHQLSSCVLII
jgi:hypothetical protein